MNATKNLHQKFLQKRWLKQPYLLDGTIIIFN